MARRSRPRPLFGARSSRNIPAHSGTTAGSCEARLPCVAPHAGDRDVAARRKELADLDEPVPFVAVVVAGIARFEVRRHPFLVNALEVLGKKRHAEPSSWVCRIRAQKAEVEVRLFPRVCGLEALK